MRRSSALLCLAVLLGWVQLAMAQSANNGLITAAGTTCATGVCVTLNTMGKASGSIQLTGTFVGTVAFEALVEPTAGTWVALLVQVAGSTSTVTTATAPGVWTYSGAFRSVRVRASAYTSGTIGVALISVQGQRGGGSSGGGAGTMTSSGSPVAHQLALFTTATDVTGLGPCTTGTYVRGATGADAICSTLTLPNAATTGDLLTATGTNAVGVIAAPAVGQLLASGGVGVASAYTGSPTVTGTMTADTFATSNAGATRYTSLEGAAPSAPAATFNIAYVDSTDHRLHDINTSGVIGTTVVKDTGAANNFLTAVSAAGVISKAQPAFTNISGSVAAAQLPNPSSSTLGGVQSYAAVSNQWINTISTSGVPASTQPAFSNLSGSITGAQLPAGSKFWKCTVIVGDPGSASSALANDNDSPVACSNDVGSDVTITTVACWADAGSPTVTPILTAGSGTSILTGALTCGTAAWAAGTVQGTAPVLKTFSGTGATCSSTPCTIDVNITTAGGTAKYLVVKLTGTYVPQ